MKLPPNRPQSLSGSLTWDPKIDEPEYLVMQFEYRDTAPLIKYYPYEQPPYFFKIESLENRKVKALDWVTDKEKIDLLQCLLKSREIGRSCNTGSGRVISSWLHVYFY